MQSGTAGEGAPETFEVPSGRAVLHGARQGRAGSPGVVLLHSGISDRRSWGEVMGVLAPDFDLVAYDRRGFGTTTYTSEEHRHVADLVRVLDALGLERVALVGNSQGGQVALDAVLAHPERFAALVLVAPAVSGAPEVTEADLDPAEAAIWETLEAADAAGALEALNLGEIRLWVDGPREPEGRVAGARRELALEMNRIALHAESPGHEPEPPDAWSRLGELPLPVLVMVGDLDVRFMMTRARALAELIPVAELAVMPGAAHLPALEQPKSFAVLLREFVLAHPG